MPSVIRGAQGIYRAMAPGTAHLTAEPGFSVTLVLTGGWPDGPRQHGRESRGSGLGQVGWSVVGQAPPGWPKGPAGIDGLAPARRIARGLQDGEATARSAVARSQCSRLATRPTKLARGNRAAPAAGSRRTRPCPTRTPPMRQGYGAWSAGMRRIVPSA